MAHITSSTDEKVFSLKKWFGLNENPDGDTNLKMGEASEMKNFRITAEGSLQVRPGTQTVAELAASAPVAGIWAGYVAGAEVMAAACDGKLWLIDPQTETATELGALDTADSVCFFGYSTKLYMLNGTQYKVWDGTALSEVTGYRPLILTETLPTGGGTALERINLLNGLRRVRFSPTGSAAVFQLPETELTSIDYVRNRVTGADYTQTTDYTVGLTDGTVTFVSAPGAGVDTIEIGYTYPMNGRAQIEAMRFAEIFNGATDNRVFFYGDETNKTFYSGLDYNGMATAEYFPDLNVLHVGDSNTPVTGLIRHYNSLLAFKEDSAYSIYYDSLTLEDGTVTAGFYLSTVNKIIGNCAPGQAALVENHPITLDGNSIYEWKATTSSGNITGDQRNASRISGKIEKTLSFFSLPDSIAFNDKYHHEYYLAYGGKAAVYNYGNGAWYIYTNFPAVCFTSFGGDVYFGTDNGQIRHVSRAYRSDDGADIPARWCSGYMDFGSDFRFKHSAMMWVGMLPESGGRVMVTLETDNKSDFSEMVIARSIATFAHVNFAEYSFSTDRRPQMKRLKLGAKKFTYYKLILSSDTSPNTATLVSVDIRVRYMGNIR